jgi:response regulator RpfG family c-di-GMP phosphodiesterase
MKVLIVEDDPNVAELLRRCIYPIATEVKISITMHDAMSVIQSVNDFDVVTLDAGLPDSRALTTLTKISEIKQYNPNTLVVVVTGMVGTEIERAAMASGADAIIFKSGHWQMSLVKTLVDLFKKRPERYVRAIEVLEQTAKKISQKLRDADDASKVEGSETSR